MSALQEARHELPADTTSFVGRAAELREVSALLASHRLVTLAGIGGIGKTRLALRAARLCAQDYGDGAWRVDLGDLADGARVGEAIAAAVHARPAAGETVDEALVRHLGERIALLLLDGCERVLPACAALAQRLLLGAPGLAVLATSQEPLRIPGEAPYPVSPLEAPPAGRPLALEAASRFGSVSLFVERARAARPDFALTSSNVAAVAAICRRLDGIALALELAAARARWTSPERIAALLDERFRRHKGGDRGGSPRKRIVDATIGWIWDLLDEDERRVLRKLSVFAGGWTPEAAQAVCADPGPERAGVQGIVEGLVAKSLVAFDAQGGRYSLTGNVRQHAAERLRESGEHEATRARHAAFHAALAERAGGPGRMRRLDAELENLLAAHAAAETVPEGAEADLLMVHHLEGYWLHRGLLERGSRLCAQALARASAGEATRARSLALSTAGELARAMGDYPVARRRLEECLRIERALGAGPPGPTLRSLAWTMCEAGDPESARACAQEAVDVAERSGDSREIEGACTLLAHVHRMAGRDRQARPLYERAASLARALGDPERIAAAELNLAMDLPEIPAMRGHAREALRIVESNGARALVPALLDVGAGIAVLQSDWRQAGLFFGASEALALKACTRRDPATAAFVAPLVEKAREEAAGVFSLSEAEGRRLEAGAAMRALARWLGPPDPARKPELR